MKLKERRIVILKLQNGKVPFELWYKTLSTIFKRAIDARFTRLLNGNFGDHKSLGSGVYELRIPKGPGLRVYYGFKDRELIVIIGGGDKGSQESDINKAKRLWSIWRNEN